MTRVDEGGMAIISEDGMRAVVLATHLRRADIPTETYFTGNFKKQLARAKHKEAVVLVLADGLAIKDMLTGRQRPVSEADLVKEAEFVLHEGYYE